MDMRLSRIPVVADRGDDVACGHGVSLRYLNILDVRNEHERAVGYEPGDAVYKVHRGDRGWFDLESTGLTGCNW